MFHHHKHSNSFFTLVVFFLFRSQSRTQCINQKQGLPPEWDRIIQESGIPKKDLLEHADLILDILRSLDEKRKRRARELPDEEEISSLTLGMFITNYHILKHQSKSLNCLISLKNSKRYHNCKRSLKNFCLYVRETCQSKG
jgi:hypothetical protein